MKLLFDQNLSHRLPDWLADIFPGSVQVRAIGLDRADDGVIWEYAKTNGFGIVTQDADFAERSRLHGSPPKVVWLRCGNSTPRMIERSLRMHEPLIAELWRDAGLHWVEIL